MAPAIAGESPVNSLLLVPDSTRLPPLARYPVDISIQIARRSVPCQPSIARAIMSISPKAAGNEGTNNANDCYTINVRGEVFFLNNSQISYDSPNYFTACFGSEFSEARMDYLSGYPVLPLSPRAISATMDMETALRYLLVDAQFYNLQGLCDLLTMPPPTVDLSWAGFANDFVNLRDVLDDTLPEGIVKRDDGSVMSEDSDLRVFVYAQDVVMKIVVTTTTFPQLGSQYSRLYESSRIVELSDPTSPTASRTYTPSVLSSDASDSEHSLGFRMDKFFDEGSLNVDGESYSMDSNTTGLWSTSHALATYPYSYQCAHRAWTFWADEVILAYLPVDSSTPSGQTTTATLISARMRTLPGILAGLRLQT
ncbi:hypothetical protein OH76DRAFT_1483481 [Lentinus brumalis]|uniref:Uncharacterized protein n=1 Tax=Lentinus brumalis TaxID=2498619 RepID=A0A371D8Z0_9APHY|nr:hypothetical protein OH76DRAFT_1483481 [Polyporus brumalis]